MLDDITVMNACADREQTYFKSSKSPFSATEIHADEDNYVSKKSILGLNVCEETSHFSDKPKNDKTKD